MRVLSSLPARLGLAAACVLVSSCGSSPSALRCGTTGEVVPNEGWTHVPEGSLVTYKHNPPASGPHYPVWAHYRLHDQYVPRPYWVHNLQHGAVVLLYRPDAPPDAVAALKTAYAAIPDEAGCGNKRALLTPDPLLHGNVAAVVADEVVERDRLDTATVLTIVSHCRGQGPEDACSDGSYPP